MLDDLWFKSRDEYDWHVLWRSSWISSVFLRSSGIFVVSQTLYTSHVPDRADYSNGQLEGNASRSVVDVGCIRSSLTVSGNKNATSSVSVLPEELVSLLSAWRKRKREASV